MVLKAKDRRQDHFYNLAKQLGFRARSAFKLSQLSKKYNLFDDVLFVVDLCAAPGGWMQVARQAVPMAGHVFGVDLVPIAPIKGCTSVQADITTVRCERLLNEAMRRIGVPDLRVELVLHDGAPNVGADWHKDAYVQNDLVLKSLELATKYLKPNGTFVTKVFRSVDYTKLLWVFKQLFGHVVSTKPSSSRNVSAEIFVVCKNYKAPAKIAPELFDVAKVFETVEDQETRSEIISKALLPLPAKAGLTMGGLSSALKNAQKKNRSGYEEGDMYRKCTVKQFFESAMPAQILVLHNRLEFNKDDQYDMDVYAHPSTTETIKSSIKDLKLLGKSDLQQLLKWRLRYLKELNQQAKEAAAKAKQAEEDAKPAPAPRTDSDDERELGDLLQAEAKEKLKRLRKLRAKFRKIQAKSKMAAAVFGADEVAENEQVFMSPEVAAKAFEEETIVIDAERVKEDEHIRALEAGSESEPDEEIDEDDGEDLDYIEVLNREMQELYNIQREMTAAEALAEEKKTKKETRRQKVYKQWAEEMQDFMADLEQRNVEARIKLNNDSDEAVGEDGDASSTDSDSAAESDEGNDATSADEDDAAAQISDDASGSSDDDMPSKEATHQTSDEEDQVPGLPLNEKKVRHLRRVREEVRNEARATKRARKEVSLLGSLGGSVDAKLQATADGQGKATTIKMVQPNIVSNPVVMQRPENLDEIAEIQAMGSILSRKDQRMDMLDGMYNRYAFNDPENLPSWFMDDDKKARVADMPMTKELYQEYRSKLKEISERPIRKVAEAKARKKARMQKKLEAIKKQVANVADSTELNERAKVQAIRKLKGKAVKATSASNPKRASKKPKDRRMKADRGRAGRKGRKR